MQPADMHAALTELASALDRLRPDWRSGEAFYELRSEISGRLRALADAPLATRTVVRPLRVEVPTPAPARLPGMLPVALNAAEQATLFAHSYERRGGYQDRFRRWQQQLDRQTGVLQLTANDTAWIWIQGSRPWKGTFQKRTRNIFWRTLAELFTGLGLRPSTVAILPTSKGRRPGPPQEAPRHLREEPPR
jgi:hypothetical protein